MKYVIILFIEAFLAVNINAGEAVDSTFTINSVKGKLAMHLQLPEADRAELPVVIICHGLTGNQNQRFISTIANDLLKEGIGVIRFDFNGHGQSDGDFQEMDVYNEMEDLRNVIAWVEKQPFTKNISLVGHSLGGIVVGMVAPEIGKDKIKALVLLASGGVAPDLMLSGNFFGIRFDPWNVPEYLEMAGVKRLGRSYIETMRDLPIYQTAAKFDGRTLVVNGMHDRIVPYNYAIRYHEVMPNSELMLIEGDNHDFSATNYMSAAKIAKWIKDRL